MTSTLMHGRELLDLIEKLGAIAWGRFEARYPKFVIKGQEPWSEDRSTHPPWTSFRFVDESPEIIGKLKSSVSNYKGKIEWIMYGFNKENGETNWTICPKHLRDMQEVASSVGMYTWKYMAEYEPEFGPLAYEDLLGLCVHIREQLGVSSG